MSRIERDELLDHVEAFIHRFVVLDDDQATVLTLWVAHTHAIEAAVATPYIAITSAMKRSGKTRLLEVLELLVRSPIRTVDITEAALLRKLSSGTYTLLLDEVDAIFSGGRSKESLRALLNAGYRRGSAVFRLKGDYVKEYDAFAAKTLSGIGDCLPDTIEDRSIRIRLQRKPESKSVERFRLFEVQEEAKTLWLWLNFLYGFRDETREWMVWLRSQHPKLPHWLNDRQQDSWEPLFALAEATSEEWKGRAMKASYQLGQGT